MNKLLYLCPLFLLWIVVGCEREEDLPVNTNPPTLHLDADTVALSESVYTLTVEGRSTYGGPQLSKVEFYKGEEKIGEKTIAPYNFGYTVTELIPEEELSFHAVLFDRAGNRVQSNTVKAKVRVGAKRIEAENTIIRGVAKKADDPATRETSSGQAKVGAIDNADSGIDATIQILAAGDYLIRVAAGTGFDGTTHKIYIDDKFAEAKVYSIPNRGWNTWQTFDLVFNLSEGTRKISIRHNTGYGELDYLEYSKL
ncbi:hypothetical protein FAZ19_21560 [Sphingobacterium alkalisoli]|uniref:CBM6 domain-containing protein n=1 Tax=Sphingobacterium alkalisoli TaxID=1874115 RepID=A0A4U0GRI7_9SPHI|nr:hypothetical protein [Sphingobacterium alkalisoli]TJY61488.1 hypothetical protein FAZ19_21560 [Sphingobacterium alkalisoli]GGH30081.1 hypothetical protein GCM10011418_41860 [Sphingobacterium alkalisoli]